MMTGDKKGNGDKITKPAWQVLSHQQLSRVNSLSSPITRHTLAERALLFVLVVPGMKPGPLP